MEEDAEVLDWGNDDDEQKAISEGFRDAEDAEDAVSLGGDEDDMLQFHPYQSREQEESNPQPSTPKQATYSQLPPPTREVQREPQSSAQKPAPAPQQASDPPPLTRTYSGAKLTHALPPKPVVSFPPLVSSTPAQITTLAGPMVNRDRRANGHAKPSSSSDGRDSRDALPPNWEVRYPRTGSRDSYYYYNVKTHESTWTRPGSVSGRSSPSKDREHGIVRRGEGRSPAPGALDDRADTSESNLGPRSTRKEPRHRSPEPNDALSYQDRHYRPGGAQGALPATDLGDRRDDDRRDGERRSDKKTRGASPPSHRDASYSVARGSSPSRRTSDRRRSRSVTPPRRDQPLQDRHARPRRDLTPPRPPADHGTWRDAPRQESEAPRHDRDWASSRNSTSMDTAPFRGRQPPTEPVASAQYPPAPRDQLARHAPAEWSTSRARSPPTRPRDGVSANERRDLPPRASHEDYARTRGGSPIISKRVSRFDRGPSPPAESPAQRGRESLGNADTIPQRRSRETESADMDADYETKRRRIGDRYSDSPPARRSAALPPTLSLPERPNVDAFPPSALQSDPTRRKRAPLPPQNVLAPDSGYFLPGPGGLAPPPYYPPRAAPSMVTDLPSDLPSAPRRQVPPQAPHNRESDIDRGVREPPRLPPVSTTRSSRLDVSPTSPTAPRDFAGPDRDVMDVDRVPPARPAGQHPQRPSGMYADRIADAQKEGLPRAPRAMQGRGPGPRPYAGLPPQPPPYSAARAQEQDPVSANALRARPPHTQHDRDDGWTQRRGPPGAPLGFSRAPVEDEDMQSRRAEIPRLPARNGLPERPVSHAREHTERMPQLDARETPTMPSRYPQRAPDGPVSGTNSVPIGNRRPSVTDQNPPHSPVERYHPLGAPERDREPAPPGRSAYRPQDEYVQSTSPTTPSARFSGSVDDAAHTQRGQYGAPSTRNSSSTFPRAPAGRDVEPPSGPRSDAYPRDAPRDALRPPRHSRFGPENRDTLPASAHAEPPRVWFTREESEHRSRMYPPQDAPPPAPAPRGLRQESETWNHYDAEPERSRRMEESNTARGGRSHDASDRSVTPEKSYGSRRQQDSLDDYRGRGDVPETRSRPRQHSPQGRYHSRADHAEDRYREPSPPASSRTRERDSYPNAPQHYEYYEPREKAAAVVEGSTNIESTHIWVQVEAQAPGSLPVSLPPKPVDHDLSLDSPQMSMAELDGGRMSKPVRIRRRPLSPKRSVDDFAEPAKSSHDDDHLAAMAESSLPLSRDMRPTPKRGNSLLSRLADAPSDMGSPSLRDRVEGSPNAAGDDMYQDPDSMEVDQWDGGRNGDPGMRGMRGKRRGMKRGRGRARGWAPTH
ncbi:hypothetical protein CERSUDRAFT_116825 [Gelatoporia subvermispora B]|uniref:WW domain-containing protein n=1 Tax=Ceriporiopsis subvermispora (strain B) TaxID=914234 RepID=M2QR41_CERS8|nr:hypothetical protein CERSUDRAFT_116825 [Gelatoporia subvermispora B]